MSKPSAIALLTVAALLGQPAKSADQEEKAIRDALMQWTTDFNEGDTEKICDIFAKELRYDYRGYKERGFEDVCALLRKSLNDQSKRYFYSLKIKELIVSDNLAVARLVWTLKTGISSLAADETVSEEPGMDIFRKQANGEWKIIRYIGYEN